MSDAAYIELPAPRKPRSFFRSWRGAVLALFLLAVILAGWFSWWLSEGKISSSYARVDTMVYTVEPDYPARVEQILVQQGEQVLEGQPLARVTVGGQNTQAATPPPVEISNRVRASAETGKNIAGKAAQARMEEEKFQKIHQDRVTDHVRAQLALRAVDRGDYAAYNQASQMEASARSRMESAREQFENVSQMRAAVDNELGRIRTEISRNKRRQTKAQQEQPAPEKQQVSAPVESALYAPAGGRVLDINVRPGQTLSVGQAAFFIQPAASNNMDTWIQAWFPLSSQKMLKTGQKAQIKSKDVHLSGEVTAIGNKAQYLPVDTSGRQYAQYVPVRIQVSDPAELARLTPGSNVECQIQTRYVINNEWF